ncbi:MAG: DCC1-like thiol-disulfide oxidoreductase family protein [Gammaproteobacteria bacterium]|nr:DCC1-like thiol-disulfide oxidoreductase family protein [Gammaproteobacteria bacterium]
MNNLAGKLMHSIKETWFTIWFQDKNTIPLEVVRSGLGFLMFFNYVMFTPADIIALYDESGILNRAVVPEMNQFTSFSFFIYFDAPWQLLTFHYVFVALCFCLFVGWKTRWVKWLVLIGHISYFNRNEFLYYGVDTVLIALLLILCIAPIGSALSLDRASQVRKHKKEHGLESRPDLPASRRGFACQRLMQIQMAVIYFSAGIEKLYGGMWWSGIAPWVALNNNETAFFPMDLLADQFWIVNLMAFGTIFIEVSYPFLIWSFKTRPYFLVAALLLHISIAVMMGMYYFAAVMIFGHLAFMRRHWYAYAGAWWRKKMGGMEMIYDGECGFCRRAMASFLAYDGLQQIKVRDYRTNPSPVVSSQDADKALYLVTGNDKAIPGFDAYRYAVLRVPGLWWQVPFFYIPVFSKLCGRPIYNWIAANRSVISQCVVKPGRSTQEGIMEQPSS